MFNLNFLTHKNFIIFLLGLAAAIPLVLITSSLSVWLVESGVSKTQIGLFALILTPYSLKFLWSPFLDGIKFPILAKKFGRRKSWLFFFQMLLFVTILFLANIQHQNDLYLTAIICLLIAFCSASQDIIIDAYRIELGSKEEQGMLTAAYVYGYRVGMLISGALVLFVAEFLSFEFAYSCLAFLFLLFAFANFVLPNVDIAADEYSKLPYKEWIKHYLIMPFSSFFSKETAWLILLFIIFFKLADAFMGVMLNPFLLEIGFSKTDIATAVKTFGLIMTLLGSFIGGVMCFAKDFKKILFISVVLQILTNFLFIILVEFGNKIYLLYIVIACENFIGGLGTVVFTAFISNLCNREFSATQFAFFTSIATIGRNFIASTSGFVATEFGWVNFFIISAVIALPAIYFLKLLKIDYENNN